MNKSNLINSSGILILTLIFGSLVGGCSGVDLANVGKLAQQTFQAAKPLSDEEEYYVGRSVAAQILSSDPLLVNSRLTEYVNLIGNTVANSSDKPFTYGGYHFAVLNSEEINAFACPGGIIFITKGMVKAVQNEDELAAVLAHEVAHINHRDGVSSIQKSRLTEVATLVGAEAAQNYAPAELSQLVGLFEGSVEDVFKTLVIVGYGKSQESNADKDALKYLVKAGYNPQALGDFLDRLTAQGQASGGGIMTTHPATAERIKKVKQETPSVKTDASTIEIRAKRFKKAVR